MVGIEEGSKLSEPSGEQLNTILVVIENLRLGRQRRPRAMLPYYVVGERVDGVGIDSPRVAQSVSQSVPQLVGGLHRVAECEHTERLIGRLVKEALDAARDNLGLARPSAGGDDDCRPDGVHRL